MNLHMLNQIRHDDNSPSIVSFQNPPPIPESSKALIGLWTYTRAVSDLLLPTATSVNHNLLVTAWQRCQQVHLHWLPHLELRGIPLKTHGKATKCVSSLHHVNHTHRLTSINNRFNIYIYNHFNKRGFRETTQKLMQEAEIAPDSTPPINTKQVLLFGYAQLCLSLSYPVVNHPYLQVVECILGVVHCEE